eukprot:UN04073
MNVLFISFYWICFLLSSSLVVFFAAATGLTECAIQSFGNGLIKSSIVTIPNATFVTKLTITHATQSNNTIDASNVPNSSVGIGVISNISLISGINSVLNATQPTIVPIITLIMVSMLMVS